MNHNHAKRYNNLYDKDSEMYLNIENCAKETSKNSKVWYKKGILLEKEGKIEEAIGCYEKAIKISPDNAMYYYVKSVALYNIKRTKESKQVYEEAIKRDVQLVMLKHPAFEYKDGLCTSKRPDKLYHYTNINSLDKILKNKTFWVTRYDFLNDFSEISYISTVVENFQNIAIENNEDEKFKIFLSKIIKDIKSIFNINGNAEQNQYIEQLKKSLFKNIYILSLTEDPDLLTLWGNYADFDGYNIGFDTKNLFDQIDRLEDKEGLYCELCEQLEKCDIRCKNKLDLMNTERRFDVYYDNRVIYENIENNIYLHIKQIYDDWKKDFESDEEVLAYIVLRQLIIYSIFIKQHFFAQEKEYRIAFILLNTEKIKHIKKIKFRTQNGAFIPHIELPLSGHEDKLHGIDSISIGPTNKSDLAKKGLEFFLEKNNLNIKVNQSQIPLRD